MTVFIDYRTILTDLQALIIASNTVYDVTDPTKLKDVLLNANDRDWNPQNMPMLDLRLKRVIPDARSNAYYAEVIVEAEIAVFDLTSRDEAATIRENLANSLQRLIQTNPRFSAMCDDTLIGVAEFGVGESKQEGAFMAGAVLDFRVFVYSSYR